MKEKFKNMHIAGKVGVIFGVLVLISLFFASGEITQERLDYATRIGIVVDNITTNKELDKLINDKENELEATLEAKLNEANELGVDVSVLKGENYEKINSLNTLIEDKKKEIARVEAERLENERVAQEQARIEQERQAAQERAQQSTPPVASNPTTPSVYYKNCTEVRNAGAAPIYKGQPGYGKHLDRDGDGEACEN